jgi:hypothetical protein
VHRLSSAASVLITVESIRISTVHYREPLAHSQTVSFRPTTVNWPKFLIGRLQRLLDPGSFPCSSRFYSKRSPPFSGPRKNPTAASVRTTGLGFGERNVTVNRSPKADLFRSLRAGHFTLQAFSPALQWFSFIPHSESRHPFRLLLRALAPRNAHIHPQPFWAARDHITSMLGNSGSALMQCQRYTARPRSPVQSE